MILSLSLYIIYTRMYQLLCMNNIVWPVRGKHQLCVVPHPSVQVGAGLFGMAFLTVCLSPSLYHKAGSIAWLTGAKRREWMGLGEWDDYY